MHAAQGRLSLGRHLARKMNISVFSMQYRITGEGTARDSGRVGSTPYSDTWKLGLNTVPSLILSFRIYKWLVKNPHGNSGDADSIPGSGGTPWRRKRQPTPVFLPGKLRGQKTLAGCSPRARRSRTRLSSILPSWLLRGVKKGQRINLMYFK